MGTYGYAAPEYVMTGAWTIGYAILSVDPAYYPCRCYVYGYVPLQPPFSFSLLHGSFSDVSLNVIFCQCISAASS